MIKYLLIFLLSLVALYAVIAAFLYFFQTNLIHIPFTNYVGTPESRGIDYENIVLNQDSDDPTLVGWFAANPQSRYTVLIFGGNAGNMSYMLDTVELFHSLGYSVFIYDFRGYGDSKGKLTEDAMYRDAESAWKYLTETRNIPSDQIVIFGRSLGGAIASWLAAHRTPAALIMESGFTSLEDMGKIYYKWLPTRYLLRFHYDSLSRISKVKCPILFIHSPDDDLTPYSHSERLFAASTAPKEFLTISGNHMQGYLESEAAYTGGIDSFLRQYLR